VRTWATSPRRAWPASLDSSSCWQLPKPDARLVVSGADIRTVTAARLLAISAAAIVAGAAALAATLPGFWPQNLPLFVLALFLGAATWGAIGAAVGALLGRLAGALVMFALPFLDVGIAQDYMLGDTLPSWGRYLPSYASVQVLIDASFSTAFHSTGELVLALAWLGSTLVAATAAVRFGTAWRRASG
jgi:hypothetical protein